MPGCSVHSSRAPCISAAGACARASRTHSLELQEALLSYSLLLTNSGFAPPSLSGNVMNGMYKFQLESCRPGMQALATSPPWVALQSFSLGLENKLLLFWSVTDTWGTGYKRFRGQTLGREVSQARSPHNTLACYLGLGLRPFTVGHTQPRMHVQEYCR